MAKPVICDRCGKVVPEEEIVQKPKYLWPPDEHFGMEVKFVEDNSRSDADICGKCGGELIIRLGKDIQDALEEAKEEGGVFSI